MLFPCHRKGMVAPSNTGAPTNGSRLDILQIFLRSAYDGGLRSLEAPYTMRSQDPKQMVQLLRRMF